MKDEKRKKSLRRMKRKDGPRFSSGLFSLFASDMAMDLGTANTLIYLAGKGIVLNEPSVVAYSKQSGEVVAVGNEAKAYLGRTPKNIVAIRPLKDGVIDDFYLSKAMICEFFLKIQKINRFKRPKAVICVPAGITQVEKRAIIAACEEVGLGVIYLIEEPMAAAIGAGLDIAQQRGRMVIDIGGGTTEAAIISRSSLVVNETVRVAGDEMNEALISYVRKQYQLAIGENSAEKCKLEAGLACAVPELSRGYILQGKDLESNLPRELCLTSDAIREALMEPVAAVVEAVHRLLDRTPKELLDQVRQDGIIMAGGGSLLRGIDTLISQETGFSCRKTDDPLTTVVMGSGMALENLERYRQVFIN